MMRSLNSITFDTSGFRLQGDINGVRVWHTQSGDGIGLFYFAKPPDIAANVNSVNEVRKCYRNMAIAERLGMIEVDTLQIDNCLAIRTIFKAPQRPTGMTYLGAITLPFRDFSYVVKVQCMEHGITGIREAIVLDNMLRSGQIELDDSSGKIKGWSQDPYDASFETPLAWNLAEDEKYDAQFPDHPLSQVRSVLKQIVDSLRIADNVKSEPRFIFIPHQAKKPWWKWG